MGRNKRREAALKAWETKRERKASEQRMEHIANNLAIILNMALSKLFGEKPEVPETEKELVEPKKTVRLPAWARY